MKCDDDTECSDKQKAESNYDYATAHTRILRGSRPRCSFACQVVGANHLFVTSCEDEK
jgi:hypothetical protein